MTKTMLKKWLAVAINLLNVALVAASIASFFIGPGAGNMEVSGTRCFMYFTIDSNILAAITSLIVLPFLFGKDAPSWVVVLKFVGTVAVTVTFLTVVCFLGPTQGYARMFDGVCLYLHLFCPILSVLSVYLPEIEKPLPRSARLFGVLPVLLYGAVYAVMVLVTEKWPDFYGFNRGGFWYISFAAMLLLGALLSALMAFLQRKAVARSLC